MTAKFHVESGFAIIGRGFVLAGEIVQGHIAVGMHVLFPSVWQIGESARIDGVEVINSVAGLRTGLLFQCDGESIGKWKTAIVSGHTIDVIDS